jgi:hypothetical protein
VPEILTLHALCRAEERDDKAQPPECNHSLALTL